MKAGGGAELDHSVWHQAGSELRRGLGDGEGGDAFAAVALDEGAIDDFGDLGDDVVDDCVLGGGGEVGDGAGVVHGIRVVVWQCVRVGEVERVGYVEDLRIVSTTCTRG